MTKIARFIGSPFATAADTSPATSPMQRIISAKGHLFDLDGTLLDNEFYALNQMQRIIQDCLSSLHQCASAIQLPENYVVAMAGKPKKHIIDMCADQAGVSMPDSAVNAAETKIIQARLVLEDGDKLDVLPGTFEYIQMLQDGHQKIAVVTSSERPRAELHVTHAGIAPYFMNGSLLSCETDLGPNCVKPNPIGYATMIQRKGLQPHECAAYEDSPSGVQAAKGAGIGCVVGIIGGSHILDKQAHAKLLQAAGADIIISSYHELIEAFAPKLALEQRGPLAQRASNYIPA